MGRTQIEVDQLCGIVEITQRDTLRKNELGESAHAARHSRAAFQNRWRPFGEPAECFGYRSGEGIA
jgi:hypothetical protein